MTSTAGYKRITYTFNTICVLLALVLIAFGIYILVSYETNDVGSLAAYSYIGVGLATVVIFVFASFAASREHVCCTVTFITLTYIILLAQLAVVALLTKSASAVASNLANSLDAAWEDELKSPGAMSIYENWFECCGRASPQDYIVNERLPPATCFRNHDSSKVENLIDSGCRIEFQDYWEHLLFIFNILGWIMIAFEFIASMVSCCLCNSIRNDRRRSYF